jgi:hypothetical protein
MRESQTEKKVVSWAEAHDILAIKFTPMGSTGWPDRVFLYSGVAIFIEFKAAGKSARPLQQERIKSIREQGFLVYVIDNVESGIKALDSAFFARDRG